MTSKQMPPNNRLQQTALRAAAEPERSAALSKGEHMAMIARVKSGLSHLLMSEAWRLASFCKDIEDAEKHLDWPQPRQHENLGHAAASVVLAAAALEAAINEIYLQAVDRSVDAFPELTRSQLDLLAQLWEVVETARSHPLKKHDVALAATQRGDMPSGEEPGQSAQSLFALRDLLVHFKPEWDDELDRHLRIEQRLRSKFEANQLSARASGRMLWFPGQCLGAGCAAWACHTASRYHSEFARRLGTKARLPADEF